MSVIKTIIISLFIISGFAVSAQTGFIKTNGKQFTLDGKRYKFIGANYWYGGLLATYGDKGKNRLQKELNFLQQNGVTNVRVMVGAEGISNYPYRTPGDRSVQPQQGIFSDSVLTGLDYLLNELGKRNMKAVLHFTNTWEWSGGLGEYLKWNGYGDQPYPKNAGYTWEAHQQYISQFYNCEKCKAAVDEYIKHMLNHTNSITGKKYIDEPAIMAWEIINEPRPMSAAAIPLFEQWMQHVSALIKSIDKNHLLTTGSEGNIASSGDTTLFKRIHADKNIDYLTIHIWPKNWGWFHDTAIASGFGTIINNATKYITAHVQIANDLHKPLVIEEFGLPRDGHSFNINTTTLYRDAWYQFIFTDVENNAAIAGCNFWAFGGVATPIKGQLFWKYGDDMMGDPAGEEQGLNSVFDSDASTWKLIRENSMRLHAEQ